MIFDDKTHGRDEMDATRDTLNSKSLKDPVHSSGKTSTNKSYRPDRFPCTVFQTNNLTEPRRETNDRQEPVEMRFFLSTNVFFLGYKRPK